MKKKQLDYEQFSAAFSYAYTAFTGNTLTDYDNWCGFRDMCRLAWKSTDKRCKAQRKWKYIRPADIRSEERAAERGRIASLPMHARLFKWFD